MPRLFYGNFDFEHELADPVGWQRPPAIRRLLAERAAVWIGLADDGDLIWTPEEIGESFWEELADFGLPRVRGVTDLDALSSDEIEIVPWGWSRSAFALARLTPTASASCARDDLRREAAVRAGNSRAWSFALEQELGVALPGAAGLERLDEFAAVVAKSAQLCGDSVETHRWVIKSNFGMAARERILGRGSQLSDSHQRWIQRRLKSNQSAAGTLFFEPWLPIREEVGLQFTIPPRTAGVPHLEGITPLLTDAQGGYRGSRFSLEATVPEKWQAAVEVALQAAVRLQELGYFGPLGIDAAVQELLNGEVVIRPLQDINARFTMGRLALGFKRQLRPSEFGEWRHFMVDDAANSDITTSFTSPADVPIRVIKTSPMIVGTQQTQHASEVMIFVNQDQHCPVANTWLTQQSRRNVVSVSRMASASGLPEEESGG
jgi:hypothetical protein